MKKLFITWGLAAAALTLFSCAKQETIVNDAQPAQAGVPFELVAGVDTKTATTDASTINWVANDALNVFVAEHNSAFGANKQFTTADGTSTFSGVLESALDGAKTYDWKVFYPYNEDILTVSTHNGTKGYLTLGSKTNATQTQAGNNNKAHLAGSHMPLYGVGNGVAGDGTPNISLTQVMSVVEVKVTNKTDSPLVVSSVDFTAPAGTLISGTFFLDFSGNTPAFTSSGPSYTSNVAKLTVSDGAAIAKDGSASFYIAVKPFTVSSGTITVAVNGEAKDKTITKEIVFAAGKIKTIEYNYDVVETVATLPFSIDGTGKSSVYSTADGLSASGLGTDYGDTHTPYYTKFDSTGDFIQIHYDVPAGKVSFGVKMIGGASTSSMTLSGSADGVSFSSIETFSISGSQNDVKNFTSSNAIDASYRYLRLTFTKGSNIGFGPFSVALPSTEINVTSDNPMAVSNENDIYAIEYSIINPVGEKSISAATDVDWITGFDYSTPGEVAFEVAAQASGAPARSGNITLSYDGADDVIVVVNQEKGANLSGVYNCTFSSKSWGVESGADFSWTSGKDGAGFSNDGIQVTTAVTGANGTTNKSFTSVSKVVVTYNTNKSTGAGTLNLKIGSNTAHSQNWAYTSGDGRTANYTCTFNIATPESGQIKLTVNTTTNSIYVVGVSVTASGMSNP